MASPASALDGPPAPRASQHPPPPLGQHAPTSPFARRQSKPFGQLLSSLTLHAIEHRLPSWLLSAHCDESQSAADVHTVPIPVGLNGSAMHRRAKHVLFAGQSEST